MWSQGKEPVLEGCRRAAGMIRHPWSLVWTMLVVWGMGQTQVSSLATGLGKQL